MIGYKESIRVGIIILTVRLSDFPHVQWIGEQAWWRFLGGGRMGQMEFIFGLIVGWL